MKTCRLISWSGIAGVLAITAMSACHTGAPPSPEAPTASVDMAITVPPNLGNVSVFIQGTRTPSANVVYGCLSTVSDCFVLDSADGFATSTTMPGAPGFGGLCPSDDDPVGDWTFTYTFYDGADCTGTVLDDGNHDFVCYAASDIGTRAYPDETYEEVISEGANENNVLCLTEEATKTFNFTVCDVLDGDPNAPGAIILDCGCTPCDAACDAVCLCPGYYGAQPDLPTGCVFNDSCEIVCGN